MEYKNTKSDLFAQLKVYLDTRIKILKYETADRGSSFFANLLVDVLVITMIVIVWLFISFTIALFLAQVFHSYWIGFGCVSLIYLLLTVLTQLAKTTIETHLIDVFIKKLFKK